MKPRFFTLPNSQPKRPSCTLGARLVSSPMAVNTPAERRVYIAIFSLRSQFAFAVANALRVLMLDLVGFPVGFPSESLPCITNVSISPETPPPSQSQLFVL